MKKKIFHLVLHRVLSRKLNELSKELGLSVSQTAVYIIKKSLAIAEKYQFSSKEEENVSGYRKIAWKKQLHIYLDEELLRKIRHLGDTMFAFSTAIIIRKLLGLYFIKTKKCLGKKFNYMDVLNRYEKIFVRKYKNSKNWDKITKQMYYPFYYQLTFNNRFALIGLKLLN